MITMNAYWRKVELGLLGPRPGEGEEWKAEPGVTSAPASSIPDTVRRTAPARGFAASGYGCFSGCVCCPQLHAAPHFSQSSNLCQT